MTRRPVDAEAVVYDDQLLDSLGAGLAPSGSDPAIQALYVWRSDLAAGVPDATDQWAFPADDTARIAGVVPVGATSLHNPPRNPAEPTESANPPRRRGRRRALAAATFVGLTASLGGATVAAADAEPGSPLWPITKVVYADRAEHRQAETDAESALAKARRALDAGRVDKAERYLDEAGRHVGEADPNHAKELRGEVDRVQDEIDGLKEGQLPSRNPRGGMDALPDSSPPPASPSDGRTTPDEGSTRDRGSKGKGKGKEKSHRNTNGRGPTIGGPGSSSSELSPTP